MRDEEIDIKETIEGPNALELLLEIGIEKLKRDYTFTLLNHLFATRDDLEKILSGQDQILILRKLHCIQCLICLCQTFLTSNRACLRSIVQQAIKTLAPEENLDHTESNLIFNITGSKVKDQIHSICPSVWQCHFNSQGSNMDIGTTCHLSVDPPANVIRAKGEIFQFVSSFTVSNSKNFLSSRRMRFRKLVQNSIFEHTRLDFNFLSKCIMISIF